MFPQRKLDDGCEVNWFVAMPVSGLLYEVWCCVLVLTRIEVFVIWVCVLWVRKLLSLCSTASVATTDALVVMAGVVRLHVW